MTRIISVVSGKGGVGKTTTVTNLAGALVNQGKSVIILDADIATPNLSLHLGIPFYPFTLHDALKKKIPITSALYEHPSGIKIIPASLSLDDLQGTDINKLDTHILHLLGQADYVVIDAAPGLGEEAQAAITVSDEILIVTNPEIPAVTDALKTVKIAQELGTKILGVVVNRKKELKHELSHDDIYSMLEHDIIATIPEDIAIPRSISLKNPAVISKPKSKSSRAFIKLAYKVTGESDLEDNRNWLQRVFGWMN